MKSLAEIQKEISELAAQIGAPTQLLPTYGSTEDAARPHIEVDSENYHYVVVERGEETQRITTRQLDDLLYHVFDQISFSLAVSWELTHRAENQDCRRLIFQQQVELLAKISPAWAEREMKAHDKILRRHPFDDNSNARVHLSKQVGWQKACEKYPLLDQTD